MQRTCVTYKSCGLYFPLSDSASANLKDDRKIYIYSCELYRRRKNKTKQQQQQQQQQQQKQTIHPTDVRVKGARKSNAKYDFAGRGLI